MHFPFEDFPVHVMWTQLKQLAFYELTLGAVRGRENWEQGGPGGDEQARSLWGLGG